MKSLSQLLNISQVAFKGYANLSVSTCGLVIALSIRNIEGSAESVGPSLPPRGNSVKQLV
jgi:hypothetical protein